MTGVSGSKWLIDQTASGLTQNPHSGTWPLPAKLELVDVNTTSVYFMCQGTASLLQVEQLPLSIQKHHIADGTSAHLGMSNRAQDAPFQTAITNMCAITVLQPIS